MVYPLLSLLGSHSCYEMSDLLYAMSTSPEDCVSMRQSGCIALLVHLLHHNDELSKLTTTTPPPQVSPIIPLNPHINSTSQDPPNYFNNQSTNLYSTDLNVFLDLPSHSSSTNTPSIDTAYSSAQCNSLNQQSNDDALGRYFIIRGRVSAALRNIINVHCEDQRGKQEMRVLRLLEQIRDYCDHIRASLSNKNTRNFYPFNSSNAINGLNYCDATESDRLSLLEERGFDTTSLRLGVQIPLAAVTALMKLTFDEEHRHAVYALGGIEALGEILELQQTMHNNTINPQLISLRRYICMALTNLTFGDGSNKALFCSLKRPLKALVLQLESMSEDLCQVAASVLRNLSWHADSISKKNLRLSGAVGMLARCLLTVKKESTLKSLLSALWNFSSHCGENKVEICATRGALQLLVWCLSFRSLTKTLAIVENGGGVLRNVSSQIAITQDYRIILRSQNCLPVLLKHLRSPSLTVVSNACGTLWNLSAHCLEDQKILCQLGAIGMLKNLVHSKHKMISMGSAAALRNLMSSAIFSDHYNDITSSRLFNHSFMDQGSISRTSLGCYATSTNMSSSFKTHGLHIRRRRDLQRELESRGCVEVCQKMVNSEEEKEETFHMLVTQDVGDSTLAHPSNHHRNDFSQRIIKSKKLSVNLTPLKPPAYPIKLNDMICKSDTEALNEVTHKINKKDDPNNHSLETDSLFPNTTNAEECYKPGLFLSCHELQASNSSSMTTNLTRRQDMASEFYEVNTLERQIKIENEDFISSTNQTFYNDGVFNNADSYNTFSRLKTDNVDLDTKRFIKNVENVGFTKSSVMIKNVKEKVELIRIRTGDEGEVVDDNCINQNRKEMKKEEEEESVLPTSYSVDVTKEIKKDDVIKNFRSSKIPTFSRNSPMRSLNNQKLKENLKGDSVSEMEDVLSKPHPSDTLFDLHQSSRKTSCLTSTSHANVPSTNTPLTCRSISSEHQQALMENANLVLSVLERTSLTESNHSNNDALSFLENETISLISGGEDDELFNLNPQPLPVFNNSKHLPVLELDSVELSVPHQEDHIVNKTIKKEMDGSFNEESMENLNSTYDKITFEGNENDSKTSQEVTKARPKIVKPALMKNVKEFDEVESKGIRGKRKALYPGKKIKMTCEKVEVKEIPSKTVIPTKFQASVLFNQKIKQENSTSKLVSKSKITSNKESSMQINNDKTTQRSVATKSASSQKSKLTVKQRLQQPPQRPLSALIKHTNITSSALSDEKIKQVKLKSQSLPPGQKAPSKNDYLNIINKNSKNKTTLKNTTKTCKDKVVVGKSNPQKGDIKQKPVMKQDTFLKSKSRSNSNDSEQVSIKSGITKKDVEVSDKNIKNSPKGVPQSRLKRPGVVSKVKTPSASSSEKLNSFSSGSLRNAQHYTTDVPKSDYTILSNKSPKNISITNKPCNNFTKYTQSSKGAAIKSKKTSNLKLKEDRKYIAEEIAYEDMADKEDVFVTKPRLQKSSTFDKINTIGAEVGDKSDNDLKTNNGLINTNTKCKEMKGTDKDAKTKPKIQKCLEDKKLSKKSLPPLKNGLKKKREDCSRPQLRNVEIVEDKPTELFVLDLSKNKATIENNKSQIASKKLSRKSDHESRNKNNIKKVEDNVVKKCDEDVKNNNISPSPTQSPPNIKPPRGFHFWKNPLKAGKQTSKLSPNDETPQSANSSDKTKTSIKSIGLSRFNRKKLSVKTSKTEDLQDDLKKNKSIFYFDNNNYSNNKDNVDIKINIEDKQNKEILKNKNNKGTKPESPIKRRVLGWFKKSHDSHQLLAKKNKSLKNIENDNDTINYNNNITTTYNNNNSTIEDNNKHLVTNHDNHTINLLQTLIDELKSDDDSTIKSQLIIPSSLPTSPAISPAVVAQMTGGVPTYGRSVSHDTASRPTKTEMLLDRHRRSRLNSDSRSSMAMSIDSLKVNSIDSLKVNSVESFANTSCSEQASETTEKDDDDENSLNCADSTRFS